MDAYKIVTDAEWKIDHNEISLGEYNDMIEPCRDVEAVVRCAECEWSKPYSDKQLECGALGLGGLKFPDDFCSYGRRKESE